MEVHAHTHTSRKKWTHYFWEFIMLFLAVFCGFLAENQREHMLEHNRAKVYAANLYDELKKDTSRLNVLINDARLVSERLDTFCMLSKGISAKPVTNGMLYFYASYATNVQYFSPHNATIEQLKGSGNLRLMPDEIAHSISEYDKKIRELEKEYGLSKTEFEKIETLHFKLFDVYFMETVIGNAEKKIRVRDSVFQLTSLSIRNDEEMMREYTGWMKFESNIYLFQNREYLEPIRKSAEALMKLLEVKYHLKN